MSRAFSSLGRRKPQAQDAPAESRAETTPTGEAVFALPVPQPPRFESRGARNRDDIGEATGNIEIELPDPDMIKHVAPEPEEPEDAFVLDSSFLDAPYTVIASINPFDEVIVVQYAMSAEASEPHIALAPRSHGDGLELFLNGQPRALVQQPNGLTEEHVRVMDVSEVKN